MATIDDLLSRVSGSLDAEAILTGTDVSQRAAGIWRHDGIQAPVIFRPVDTAQVALILAACNDLGQTVVTHGGLTGLAKGAIAGPQDVVLSTERLNKIEHLDPVDRLLQVQAGVKLQTAQERAEQQGLMLTLDLGARGSCTLGGNAATNAGGNRVLRYGMTRDQVLGLEVVLADGTVLSSMHGMLKNNAGYDLKQLFIGTEGTLGVITRLNLRLRPQARSQDTALLSCSSFEQITGLLAFLDQALAGTLSAFELMWRDFYLLAANGAPPLAGAAPYYILVEAMGSDPDADAERFMNVIEQALQKQLLDDALLCKSGAERAALWALRDNVEPTLEHGPAVVFDVSLRLSQMEAYVAEVLSLLDGVWGKAHTTWVFGHAGDGNLHFIVAAGDGSAESRERSERCVYAPLQAIGGSVSGEHGIGLEKKNWLSISRTAEELRVMRMLKATLDPNAILNPGRVFDVD